METHLHRLEEPCGVHLHLSGGCGIMALANASELEQKVGGKTADHDALPALFFSFPAELGLGRVALAVKCVLRVGVFLRQTGK